MTQRVSRDYQNNIKVLGKDILLFLEAIIPSLPKVDKGKIKIVNIAEGNYITKYPIPILFFQVGLVA